MNDYGIKVSKEGENVLTALDDDLAYSSKFNTLKVYKKGSISITTDGSGNADNNVVHNLSFAPAFKCFIESGGIYYPDPSTVNRNFGNDLFKLHAYTDTNKFYFSARGASPSTTYYAKYFVFADLAQSFASPSVSLPEDYGLKVSQDGVDVKTAEIYELSYTSSLQALKFDDAKVGSFTMSLPAKNCTDSPTTQSTYHTISHGLGYPPFILFAFKTNNSQIYPSSSEDRHTFPWSVHGFGDAGIWVLEARWDSVTLRVDWYRDAQCVSGAFPPCDLYCQNWNAETVTVYYYMFREDLSVL